MHTNPLPMRASHALLPLESPHVLLVEDDPDLLAPFRRALHHVDPDLILDWRANEWTAVEAMRDRPFAAIVSDYALDQGNGLSVCRAAIDLGAAPSLAMISCHPLEAELARLGGSRLRFLRKPFSQSELTRFLRSLL